MSRDDRARDPPNVSEMFTLKVDNISFRTTTDSLRDKFSHYGEVGDVYIPRNYSTNEPRGFAFVRFADKRDAEDAQRALDGADIDGREIRIQEAKERRPENPRQYMASRSGYGGRDSYSDRDRDRDSYRRRSRSGDRYGSSRGGRDEYGRGSDRDRGRDSRRGRSVSRSRSPSRDRERYRRRSPSPAGRRRSRSRSDP